jgi:hypothetical protein
LPEKRDLNLETPAITATLQVIGLALGVRLILMSVIGLGADESYTVAVSRQLSLSYFDHPPLHQWMVHALSPLLGEGRLIRLPFVLAFAATSLLLFRFTSRLFDAWSGFWAVVGLNLAGFFTVSAGSWVVPDGLLLLSLAGMAFYLARLLVPLEGEVPMPWRDWLMAGLCLGLAGLSKYQAVLPALGLGFFLIATARGRMVLRHPAPWLAAVLAGLIVMPVFIWNAQNGYASFLFQAARSDGGGFKPWLIPASLAAQAGWLLPWVFVPMARALWVLPRPVSLQALFCLSLGLPAILVFTVLPAFGALGLPHWSMPGWFFLFPLLGAWLAHQKDWPRRRAKLSAIGSGVVLAILASHVASGWLGSVIPALRAQDPTIETHDWRDLPGKLRALGIEPCGKGFILADGWQNAGKIALALGPDCAAVMPATRDPRHHAFLHDQRKSIGEDAIVIVRARRDSLLRAELASRFAILEPSQAFSIGRMGQSELALTVFRAKAFAHPLDWAYGLAHDAKRSP